MRAVISRRRSKANAIRATSLVITTPDYRRWQSEAQSLLDQMLSDFQRYVCVFIGYSLRDPNIRLVLGLVESKLGHFAPRHFAVTKTITRETTVGWKDLVGVRYCTL